MNHYELICRYCNSSWQVDYVPQETVYCQVCNDTNIKIIDIARDKIDQYVNCPPFVEIDENWNI
jgi:hypothetical protein